MRRPPISRCELNAANPAALFARALTGERAAAADGRPCAALASDIQWLVDNLRWDAEADLERVFGPVVAHQLARVWARRWPRVRVAWPARRGCGPAARPQSPGPSPRGMTPAPRAALKGCGA